MWVIGPYEVVWVLAALVFLILAPPLMGLILAYVRGRRAKTREEAKGPDGPRGSSPGR